MTEGGELTAVPAVADWLVALFAASVAAAPAVAVALKVTGDPAPVACTVCVPAVVPSVQVVVAMPLPLLVDVVGLTDPLPVAGVPVTGPPPPGFVNRPAPGPGCPCHRHTGDGIPVRVAHEHDVRGLQARGHLPREVVPRASCHGG